MFFDDALLASRELERPHRARLRQERAPMRRVSHAADAYIARLIERGYKVAICEQTETRRRQGLVKREVIRVVTPGTVSDYAACASGTTTSCARRTLRPPRGLAFCD